MTGIWDFPELEALEEFIVDGIETAIVNEQERLESPKDILVGRLSLSRILVVGEWGIGTAERGEDILSIILFFDMEGEPRPHTHPNFDNAARTVTIAFAEMVAAGEISPPSPAFEWFPDLDPVPAAISQYEDNVSKALGKGERNRVFDLTTKQAIGFEEGANVQNLPRTPLEQLRSDEEPEDEQPEAEEPSVEQDEPVEEGLEPEIEFPEVNPSLRPFAISERRLEIPAGKETKQVEVREPYKFELMMALPLEEIRERGLESGDEPANQLTNGIGFQVQIGRLGTGAPPATFPRTSSYIKNRLMYEGPAYILELYNDLVVYSGFISGYYNMNLKTGHYDSFREFIYRLRQIGERGGPELIEELSQQAAASRGLETTADHPTIEGEKAPWLENRKYYQIVEENFDHEAWKNPVEYLQEELAEE